MTSFENIEWERHERLRNVGYMKGSPSVVTARTYTRKGKLYPRYSIVVRRSRWEQGVELYATIKWTPHSWWDRYPIPASLLGDAIAMLTKAKEAVS